MAVAQNMGGKAYAAFVSHCKAECAMEARFLQTELEAECGQRVFIGARSGHAPGAPLARLPAPSHVFAPAIRRFG